ncbi:DEAD/DEAH box helicase [Mucilaginibacter pedocola]|uniref:DEAD/DEAH box helicase n=1 Tax=Mucilaginibacter pedocola TaxID=1792845 RepID=A0A1S9P7V6_9SPHI|nr:DEAD/DEAH box helicase [Mucilaginibacter pedocola]OOQ56728.1 hypothetical protein BC343_17195 [Mucilaginibacter pedocola]
MAFELLSEPIRRYIREEGWESFRPIQDAAIKRITSNDDHYILASRTASGKTEAAFLPILSKVNFNEPGVQVLYVSPLIALINDQFERVEKLCKHLDADVTKWHGEASQGAKNRLIKEPQGIVLITPESIEAMFVNKPFQVKLLFGNLKYVVIDEIHAFVGQDRGVQLKSLLARLQAIQSKPFSIVGLSATLGDFAEAKNFTGTPERTTVLLDRTAKPVNANFKYYPGEGSDLPLELMKDLYLQTYNKKVLVFPNNRGRAEEVAVKLLKLSDRLSGHKNYFSHHSSVHKQVREYIEEFAKTNKYFPFTISCTSTLELGIDIGTVDEVVQIDATHSIASMVQRIGRSGRREGATSLLCLYATDAWSLLQALACWLLFQEGFVEPPATAGPAYDVLLHQALSITRGHSGIDKGELITRLKSNFAFGAIPQKDVETIVAHLIASGMLEAIRNEVIIGIDGEKIVNSMDFYSMFTTDIYFKVVNAGVTIGQIPLSPQVKEDENILLAAKIWKIIYVDLEAKRIEVARANDGKKPLFFGGAADVHQRIRRKMLDIVLDDAAFDMLDAQSMQTINELRADFAPFKIKQPGLEMPLLIEPKQLKLFTFCGSKENRTIELLFDMADLKNTFDSGSSCFTIQGVSFAEFDVIWQNITSSLKDIDSHLLNLVEKNPGIIDFSKWGGWLPLDMQVAMLKQKYFDLQFAESLSGIKLAANMVDDMPAAAAAEELVAPLNKVPYEDMAFRKFTSKSEADKAINSLKGILLGINMDGEVNDAEVAELMGWCAAHHDLINRNPFKEFMVSISEALSAKDHRSEIINDLYWLCQKYETDSYYYDAATSDLQILQGICHGILADGYVADAEVFELKKWLDENRHLASYYPYDEISALITDVLADGKIGSDERLQLMACFNEFAKLNNTRVSAEIKQDTKQASTMGIYTASPDITATGKSFCFTGVSTRAKRTDIEQVVLKLGSKFQNNVSQKTDYLIIGDGGNPCWAYACYGRKVEQAINLQKQGHQIALLHENDFWNFVERVNK